MEDLTTRAYLSALWGHDRRIAMYVGGGAETLKSVVEDAHRSGRDHVFALRDRDFTKTNRHRWSAPDVRTFTLETFEVECFLLDPVALAVCPMNTANRTEVELRARLSMDLHAHLWWMATRRTIYELGVVSSKGFPKHPKRTKVSSRAEAEAWVLGCDWMRSTVPGLSSALTDTEVSRRLDAAHGHYLALAGSDSESALAAISGKEILRALLSWVWTKGRPPGPQAEEDLAKAVAHAQRKAGRVPMELEELRMELLGRLSP
ncbi:MAG: hypothetical protein H6741_09145 [Alphaproteobacteria bacterium]|nr:hypothetical protein [Alphaproteobacteria bacterium]MCB9792879.1 hypothetical protein [Alphaproteobacteria bacterium]